MGFPEYNFSTIEAHKKNRHVRSTVLRTGKIHKCHERIHSSSECEYRGIALSALRQRHSGTKLRVQQHSYSIKCYKDRSGKIHYFVPYAHTKRLDVRSLEESDSISMALSIAYDPLAHHDFVSELLSKPSLLRVAYRPQLSLRLDQLLSKQSNPYNAIDKERTTISLDGVKVTPDTKLHAYVNNTYVNIVHDCNETVCIQPILSNRRNFMPLNETENYGLLCIESIHRHNALLENTTQFTNSSIVNRAEMSAFASIVLSIVLVIIFFFTGTLVMFGSGWLAQRVRDNCGIDTCVNGIASAMRSCANRINTRFGHCFGARARALNAQQNIQAPQIPQPIHQNGHGNVNANVHVHNANNVNNINNVNNVNNGNGGIRRNVRQQRASRRPMLLVDNELDDFAEIKGLLPPRV